MALMWLAARWARETGWPGALQVAVVDHGLRPEAANEAVFVLREAARLGLAAQVLKWTGPHPGSGIPAAAREARYGLLCGLARLAGAVVVTAHTQDDQAETFLMRLARGSGVDGLSAMDPHILRDGVELMRPLLGVSRARLRTTLQAEGVGWIDDPTNENTAHERVRIRKALETLEGIGVTREAIALSAARLGRARSALDHSASEQVRKAVRIEANAYATIDLYQWLLQLARCFGGGSETSLSGAEAVSGWLLSGKGRARTFGGCMFARRKSGFVMGREPSRVPGRQVSLAAGGGTGLVWDDRYEITVPAGLLPATVVPASLCAGLVRPSDVPDFVWRGLPAVSTPQGAITPVDVASGDNERSGQVEFRLIRSPVHVHDDG